jgi:hypothetical protein
MKYFAVVTLLCIAIAGQLVPEVQANECYDCQEGCYEQFPSASDYPIYVDCACNCKCADPGLICPE